MQVVVLCGGSGTRLREMSEFIPKPLISIGPYPMVIHIMKLYSHYGFNDFVLALGYKQEAFKQYFAHYDIINNDITIDLGRYHGVNHHEDKDRWMVTLADTGVDTLKGGRLKRVEKYIIGDTFFVSYGDGISNININDLLAFHHSHGKIATMTGVIAPPRFGEIHQDGDTVISFSEKPIDDTKLINSGFFVFNRKIFDYLTSDRWCDLEMGTLELIAAKGEMKVFKHIGYFGCMDTLRDVDSLQKIWESGEAPWIL